MLGSYLRYLGRFGGPKGVFSKGSRGSLLRVFKLGRFLMWIGRFWMVLGGGRKTRDRDRLEHSNTLFLRVSGGPCLVFSRRPRLGGFGRFWKVLGGFGGFWRVLGGFSRYHGAPGTPYARD